MIKMSLVDGRSIPCFCCDECKQPITDVQGALALWIKSEDPASSANVYVVHKGTCDRLATEKLRKLTLFSQPEYTEELSTVMVQLLLSLKMIGASIKPDGTYEYDLNALNAAIQRNEDQSQI